MTPADQEENRSTSASRNFVLDTRAGAREGKKHKGAAKWGRFFKFIAVAIFQCRFSNAGSYSHYWMREYGTFSAPGIAQGDCISCRYSGAEIDPEFFRDVLNM